MIPEIELLLRCARIQLASDAVERVEQLLQGPLDWDLLQKHACDHGLLVLLARTLLSSNRFLVPPEVRKNLEDFSRQNSERNRVLSDELLKITAHCEQSGIAAVGYEGPALAALAYGDIALRQFGALDVLFRPQDVQRAHDLFIRLGYQPEFEFSPKQERAYRRVGSEYCFKNKAGIQIALHWRILPTHYCLNFNVDDAFNRVVTIDLSGSQLKTLSPEDSLLALTVHGSSYAWGRLHSVCDVAHVIGAWPQMNWPQVWQQARKDGTLRLLRVALTLAAGLFGAPISRTLEAEITRDKTALELAAELADSLTSLGSGVPLNMRRLLLQGRERWRDRARYLANFATKTLAARLSRKI